MVFMCLQKLSMVGASSAHPHPATLFFWYQEDVAFQLPSSEAELYDQLQSLVMNGSDMCHF